MDQATGAAVFSGGVTVGQGDLRLQAGTVEVRYDDAQGRIVRLLASGGVTLATPTEAAEAEAADYDLVAQTLTHDRRRAADPGAERHLGRADGGGPRLGHRPDGGPRPHRPRRAAAP